MAEAEAMRGVVASMLKGIDRYNPENLSTLEKYIEIQAKENAYDLEANLAVLKLYQFNPTMCQVPIVKLILLKALTNLPHTDFVLCKCLLDQQLLADEEIKEIIAFHNLLETCQFVTFWNTLHLGKVNIFEINGFEDSIRKFICHVVNITYQHIEKNTLVAFLGGPDFSAVNIYRWMSKYSWKSNGDLILINNQEENIKTKNITEKIDFESVAAIMALTR